MFGIKVHYNNEGLTLPCKGDQWMILSQFCSDRFWQRQTGTIEQGHNISTYAVLVMFTRCFREVFGCKIYEEKQTG